VDIDPITDKKLPLQRSGGRLKFVLVVAPQSIIVIGSGGRGIYVVDWRKTRMTPKGVI
jgi:hypothetical protein